ncbi:putative lipase C4A8.10 isoform X4 [Amborella trichopoda]|uniref:putative lipase C4A8.10 isoform X4 n=1 Tax=Amborella trichopoda TaxID=13333 RepID=UPI0009BFA803|nr:putative lipase C4A8.10 isoform X4 [Amborella trichopoda]|eukprot:XP_020525707.1 putative lipase C4A8.10 isoform X4 [Amborella trichopoda]
MISTFLILFLPLSLPKNCPSNTFDPFSLSKSPQITCYSPKTATKKLVILFLYRAIADMGDQKPPKKPSSASNRRKKRILGSGFDCFSSTTIDTDGVEIQPNGLPESGNPSKSPARLIVMVNGIIGSAANWKFAAKQFVRRFLDDVIVHCSECNSSTLTFDGVDALGERLAAEVKTVINRWPGLQKISFVAHSLGGLVARFAIGRLYEKNTSENADYIDGESKDQNREKVSEVKIAGLEPMNFITFATPHLGSRGHRQLPCLCGFWILEKVASRTAHWIAGRSGKHLFLNDHDEGRPPLLLRMVNVCDGLYLMSALKVFNRCVAYSNADFDHMVGWRTSSIRWQHELPRKLLFKNEKYPHIVNVETAKTEKGHQAVLESKDNNVDFEGKNILDELRWC